MTFEASRFPSENVLGVKCGCQRRPVLVIECSFEGGHNKEGSGTEDGSEFQSLAVG